MKAEKILEILNHYITTLPEDEGAVIQRIVDSQNKVEPRCACGALALANLMIDLRAEIAISCARAAGRASVLAACKRILNVARKNKRTTYAQAWIGKDGRQYLCNGFLGVALTSHVEVPSAEDGPVSLEKTISMRPSGAVPIALPDLGIVKTHIKLCVANGEVYGPDKRVFWDFGAMGGLYDARYLADVLAALPGCTGFVLPVDRAPTLFLQAPDGSQGVLCPVQCSKDSVRENTAARYGKDALSELSVQSLDT